MQGYVNIGLLTNARTLFLMDTFLLLNIRKIAFAIIKIPTRISALLKKQICELCINMTS